jgi:hypothetical protein
MKTNLRRSGFDLLAIGLPPLCFMPAFSARPVPAAAPPGQNGAPQPTKASKDSKIEIENWAKPEPGWLDVLDAKPDTGGAPALALVAP